MINSAVQGSGQLKFRPNLHLTRLGWVTEKLIRTRLCIWVKPIDLGHQLGRVGFNDLAGLTMNWVKFVDFFGFYFFGPLRPELMGFLNNKDLKNFEFIISDWASFLLHLF